jgi:hypothetical protein
MAAKVPTDAQIGREAAPSPDGETGARACRNSGNGGWRRVRSPWPERCRECHNWELRNALIPPEMWLVGIPHPCRCPPSMGSGGSGLSRRLYHFIIQLQPFSHDRGSLFAARYCRLKWQDGT